jgi:hypothetical protein
MAEVTTTSLGHSRDVSLINSAVCAIAVGEPTEVPPNFITRVFSVMSCSKRMGIEPAKRLNKTTSWLKAILRSLLAGCLFYSKNMHSVKEL